MVTMQQLTLEFYDQNWKQTGWASGDQGSESEYQKWRAMTEEEISGRWGPVSYMIAIIMQRQAHPEKRMPEWEEAAATACAVQNMHIQASAEDGLGCYWTSWHPEFRDSEELSGYLGMEKEDKCLGFFVVGRDGKVGRSDQRVRNLKDHVEWKTE